jgi:hypothetical protein
MDLLNIKCKSTIKLHADGNITCKTHIHLCWRRTQRVPLRGTILQKSFLCYSSLEYAVSGPLINARVPSPQLSIQPAAYEGCAAWRGEFTPECRPVYEVLCWLTLWSPFLLRTQTTITSFFLFSGRHVSCKAAQRCDKVVPTNSSDTLPLATDTFMARPGRTFILHSCWLSLVTVSQLVVHIPLPVQKL